MRCYIQQEIVFFIPNSYQSVFIGAKFIQEQYTVIHLFCSQIKELKDQIELIMQPTHMHPNYRVGINNY